MKQGDAYRDFEFAWQALRSGDAAQLEALAALEKSFPHGEDGFLGRRWIINAIDSESASTVQWLLARGVDLNFRDDEGYTPIHTAIECNEAVRYEILQMLLVAGANVNLKGINDYTPAHHAAARDDVDALKMLISFGADLTIRTSIDSLATPLEEARALGRMAAAAFLASVA